MCDVPPQVMRDFEADDRKKRDAAKRPATASAAGGGRRGGDWPEKTLPAMGSSIGTNSTATNPFDSVKTERPLLSVKRVTESDQMQSAQNSRAARAHVQSQNVELASQLDENDRIIAMQRLEIGVLRSHVGGGLRVTAAKDGPTVPRPVFTHRGRGGAQGDGEERGLFQTVAQGTGPFSSKPARLQER